MISPGDKFHRLTVVRFVEKRGRNKMFLCRCQCGNEKVVYDTHLRRGNTKSCGCLSSEMTAARNYKHGHAARDNQTPEYLTWARMVNRCCNEAYDRYSYYGGRGIKVCRRWRFGADGNTGFECFLEDMGRQPEGKSIDRMDNNGNYTPLNCRWATWSEQMQNQRPRTTWRGRPVKKVKEYVPAKI